MNKESYRDDRLLVSVLTATLNEDKFDTGESSKDTQFTEFTCMSSLDSKIDEKDELQKERLFHVKNQVFEKLKTTKIKRADSRKRRASLLGIGEGERSSSKPRMEFPTRNNDE